MRIDFPYDDDGFKRIDQRRFGRGIRGRVRQVLMREGILPFPESVCIDGKGIVEFVDGDELVIAWPGLHDEVYGEAGRRRALAGRAP